MLVMLLGRVMLVMLLGRVMMVLRLERRLPSGVGYRRVALLLLRLLDAV
jgi:hypothetical protein